MVSALGYSTVLFVGIWGILIWNEVLPAVAWLGMALIMLGGAMSGILNYRMLIIMAVWK